MTVIPGPLFPPSPPLTVSVLRLGWQELFNRPVLKCGGCVSDFAHPAWIDHPTMEDDATVAAILLLAVAAVLREAQAAFQSQGLVLVLQLNLDGVGDQGARGHTDPDTVPTQPGEDGAQEAA